MRSIQLIFTVSLLCASFPAVAQLRIGAGYVASYGTFKSFDNFRKTYNETNAPALKHKLGSLSDQYGFNVSADYLVPNHYFSSVEYQGQYATAKATFNNGAKRVFKLRANTVSTFIGWRQEYEKSSWTLAGGLSFSFGNVTGFLKMPEGTRYHSTGGLSGEFTGVRFGGALKFEYDRAISEKIGFRFGFNTYFLGAKADSEYAMTNTFTTLTEGELTLNGQAIKYNITRFSAQLGLYYQIF
jgi:hypothetical protein